MNSRPGCRVETLIPAARLSRVESGLNKGRFLSAYEGSYTDGPFQSSGRYRRDNVNANYTRSLGDNQKLGFRFIFGRNNFNSSGQIPLDLVNEGLLNRFGYVDPSDGGRVKLGTLSSYYSRSFENGDTLKGDAFVGRSLFDLYSNFTFYLNDPVTRATQKCDAAVNVQQISETMDVVL
jgi:hypothetical protein